MKFLIAIEPGTERTAYGVVVPDLPGCFSAGGAEAADPRLAHLLAKLDPTRGGRYHW